MNRKIRLVVFGSLLSGLVLLAFCIRSYFQLSNFDPAPVITAHMFKQLVLALKILTFGVILPMSGWLIIVSVAVWRYSKSIKGEETA